MEKWTSSPLGTTEHLEPEVLASFLDGQLSEDENREVRRHLAECEECYEVFVSTVNFLREEEQREAVEQGNVFPFAEADRRTPVSEGRPAWGRRLAVAATVVLAMGTGASGYRMLTSAEVPANDLRAAVTLPDSTRSVGTTQTPIERSLKLGALRTALAVGMDRGEDTTELLAMMDALMAKGSSFQGIDRSSAENLLAADLRDALGEPGWYDLGAWATVGKAAAEAEQEEVFRGSLRSFRFGRVLARLQRDADGSFDGETFQRLKEVGNLLDASELDYGALENAFDALLVSH